MKVTAARAAGSALQKYFANLLNVSGQAGNLATRELLKAGTKTFAPNVATSALNPFLRSGAASITPKIGGLAAQTAVVGAGLSGTTSVVDKMFDQQSQHSQGGISAELRFLRRMTSLSQC